MPKSPEAKAVIQQAIDEIKKKKEFDKDAGGLLASMEEGLVKAIGPALERVIGQMEKSIKGVKMDAPNVSMPEMELDMTPVAEAIKDAVSEAFKGVTINVPEVKLPAINVPEVKMPAINIPPQVVNEVFLKGVGTKNPMPVAIYGLDGKPLLFPFGSSGAKANFITLKGMLTPNGDSMVDETNDALRVNMVTGTLSVAQASGSADSVNVIQFGGQDVALNSGVTNAGTLRVVQVTDVASSVNVVGFSGSVAVVGDTEADAPDSGSAPLKVGGIARTANPTAVAAGDRVSATYDDVGRQVMRINQVRDLIQTAYATLSNGTETTLLASASGVFSDLIYIMGANDSGAAVQVDIRAATGANKVMTLEIPANGTAGVSLPIPLPQDVAADTWTCDMPDITGTNVYISALFSKEV